MEIDFGDPKTFNAISIIEFHQKITSDKVQCDRDGTRAGLAGGTLIGPEGTNHRFDEVAFSKMRLYIVAVNVFLKWRVEGHGGLWLSFAGRNSQIRIASDLPLDCARAAHGLLRGAAKVACSAPSSEDRRTWLALPLAACPVFHGLIATPGPTADEKHRRGRGGASGQSRDLR